MGRIGQLRHEAIKMAREHGDLRVEFELYYCLMQVQYFAGL